MGGCGMNKPLGLKVIAWLSIIGGILGLGMMLFGSTFVQEVAKKENISALQMFYSTATSVLGIIFGIGLLSIKKWAWFGMIVIEAVGIVQGAISIIMSLNKSVAPSGIVGVIFGLVFYGIIIAYLMRNDIRQLFQISELK